jgi:hypothetical protein
VTNEGPTFTQRGASPVGPIPLIAPKGDLSGQEKVYILRAPQGDHSEHNHKNKTEWQQEGMLTNGHKVAKCVATKGPAGSN